MPGRIFVNYRRAESVKDARHLATLLDKGPFKGRVFIDLKGLDGSRDWLHELERQVAASEAMVSVICRDWVNVKGPDGKQRIHSDRDFVRFELAEAFRRGIPVIPVLVDDARMPRGAELPDNLLYLTRPQAEFLRQETFEDDVEKIARRVAEDIRARRRTGIPAWSVAAAALGSLLAGAAGGIVTGPLVTERLGLTQTTTPSDAQATNLIAQLRRELAEANARVRDIQAGRLRVEEELKLARAELGQTKDEATRANAAGDAARQQVEALGKLAEIRGREIAAAEAKLANEQKARVAAEANAKQLADAADKARRDTQTREKTARDEAAVTSATEGDPAVQKPQIPSHAGRPRVFTFGEMFKTNVSALSAVPLPLDNPPVRIEGVESAHHLFFEPIRNEPENGRIQGRISTFGGKPLRQVGGNTYSPTGSGPDLEISIYVVPSGVVRGPLVVSILGGSTRRSPLEVHDLRVVLGTPRSSHPMADPASSIHSRNGLSRWVVDPLEPNRIALVLVEPPRGTSGAPAASGTPP